MSHLLELVDEADKNKDGKIDFDEWQIMGAYSHFHAGDLRLLTHRSTTVNKIKKKIPMSEEHLGKVHELHN